MTHSTLFLASLVVCVASATPAYAQTDRTLNSRIKASQKAFDRGVKAYASQRFDEAATLFSRAHAILPEAMYLYNAGKAMHRAGIFEVAASTLRAAVAQKERALPEKTSSKAGTLITEIEAELARRNARAGQMSVVGWTGAGLVGAGCVLLATTVILGSGLSQDLEGLSVERDRARYDARRSELEGTQSLLQVLYPSAWALLGVGAGLVTWDLVTPGGLPWEVAVLPLPEGGAQATFKLEFWA